VTVLRVAFDSQKVSMIVGKTVLCVAGCIDYSVHCNGTESVYAFGQCLSPSSPVYWPNSTLLTDPMSGQPMSAQQVADYRNEAEANRQSSGEQYLYVFISFIKN
jgi:hypothetical protein